MANPHYFVSIINLKHWNKANGKSIIKKFILKNGCSRLLPNLKCAIQDKRLAVLVYEDDLVKFVWSIDKFDA